MIAGASAETNVGDAMVMKLQNLGIDAVEHGGVQMVDWPVVMLQNVLRKVVYWKNLMLEQRLQKKRSCKWWFELEVLCRRLRMGSNSDVQLQMKLQEELEG
ncbi:hypothetical protein C5167_045278 [Papaver somniferum]|uniref:Uncharacterized protein n=1 Tax=Papaver somniferum TaxID=3469 RepID=A0A4Y7LB62_PAPSO|nr:hypothetical protein C5167_045278 [Papaver somniferum]